MAMPNWPDQFADIVKNEKIEIKEISTLGEERTFPITVLNAIQQFHVKAQAMVNLNRDDIIIDGEVFDGEIFDPPMNSVQRQLYYIIENASTVIRDQVDLVHDHLIEEVKAHGETTLQVSIAVAIVCSLIVIFSSSMILPFMFNLIRIQSRMLTLLRSIDTHIVGQSLQQTQQFSGYMQSNAFIEGGKSRIPLFRNTKLGGTSTMA